MSSPRGRTRAGTELETLADRLHSASIHLLRRIRRVDESAGLSPSRLSALSVVVFGGPLTLGALAAAEQVKPPTMSRIVAALEQDGLVQRAVDPADRRSILLRATGRGTRLMQAGRRRRVAALAEALAELEQEEAATLSEAVAVLERLFGGRH